MNHYFWATMNFGTSVFLISTAVVAIQGPIRSIMYNQIRHNQWLPPMPEGQVGLLATARALYRGTGAGMAGSSARTAYVTSSKNSMESVEMAPEEVVNRLELERPRSFIGEMSKVMAFSLGDVVITQIPDGLSQLKKMDIIASDFNWKTPYHLKKLFMVGFGSRLGSSAVNFSAMCLLEPTYASMLAIENDSSRHFVAGAMSGATASVFSFPFNYYKDYVLAQAKLDKQAQLQTLSVIDIYKQVSMHMQHQGVLNTSKQAWNIFYKQVPVRLLLTASIFATVAGVDEWTGDEPFTRFVEKAAPLCKRTITSLGFFSSKNHNKLVEKKEDQNDVQASCLSEPWYP